jgi:PAS domain S-box-containing protein
METEVETKNSLQALQSSETRYRRLFETAQDGILILNAETGEIDDVNPYLIDMLHYSHEEFLGKKLWEVSPFKDTVFNRIAFDELQDKGYIRYKDLPLETKEGKPIAVEFVSNVYKANGDKVIQCNIRNITERKRADEALRESEGKYRWVLDNMVDVITVIDMNLRFTYVSPSIMRMRGYTAEEATAQTIEQVMTPKSLQIVAKAFEEEMKLEASGTADPGRGRILEVEQYRKDGSIVLMENHLSFLRDATQKAVGIISLTRDITDRKRMEDKLRDSEDHLHTLVQTIPDLIWLKDKDGVYLSCNTMFERFFGAREADIVGKTDYDFVDRELADSFLEHDRTAMAAGKPTINEEWITFADDGHRAFLETIKMPMHASQGTLIGVLGIGRDITERKQSEEALLKSEEKYRLIAENMADIISVSDMNLRFTYISPSIMRIRGFTVEEAMGQTLDQVMTPESLKIIIAAFEEEMKLETSGPADPDRIRIMELEEYKKDGSLVWIEMGLSYLRDKDSKPIAMLAVSRDISARKRAEDRYRSIFENAQEGIFRSTPDGKILMANQAMAKMFGYESPEDIVASITDTVRQHYVNPEDRDKLKELIEEHGFAKGYEAQLYRKDGSIIWISMTMHAVRDKKGQILYYDGIDEDITNRKESAERIKKALGATVQAIAVTVETRDPYTAGHQRRVADLARAIATEMNLPADQIDGIHMAAAIHDLGKLSVPAEILSKPTKLTNIEFSLIKTHPQSGYEILKDIDFPWPIARMIQEHHERMDGLGYPNGLKGDNLLLESRILSVADVVESMSSHRPYRPSLGIEAALEEIEKNKGTHYDNAVADACLRIFREKGFQLQGT